MSFHDLLLGSFPLPGFNWAHALGLHLLRASGLGSWDHVGLIVHHALGFWGDVDWVVSAVVAHDGLGLLVNVYLVVVHS